MFTQRIRKNGCSVIRFFCIIGKGHQKGNWKPCRTGKNEELKMLYSRNSQSIKWKILYSRNSQSINRPGDADILRKRSGLRHGSLFSFFSPH